MPLLLVKATLVFALGLLVTRLARRARASVRHMVLASTFGVVVLMPGVAALLPSFGIPVLPAAYPVPVVARVASDSPASVAIAPSAAASSPQKSSREWFTLSALVGASWCAGVALSLLSMVAGLRRIRRVCQAARPWPADAKRTERVATLAALRRPVEILLHDEIPAPMTCGLLRPRVLLPADALDWNDADLRRALVHELEHVRRGDWFVHGLARVVCALYWFHPLAWIARRHLGLAAEHACDDAVARVTQPAAYAEQLVTLAQRLSARVRPGDAVDGGHGRSIRARPCLTRERSGARTCGTASWHGNHRGREHDPDPPRACACHRIPSMGIRRRVHRASLVRRSDSCGRRPRTREVSIRRDLRIVGRDQSVGHVRDCQTNDGQGVDRVCVQPDAACFATPTDSEWAGLARRRSL